MNYTLAKAEAIKLRIEGFSLKQISDKLDVSKSTASLWLRNVALSEEAQARLAQAQVLGRANAFTARQQKSAERTEIFQNNALNMLKTVPNSPELAKIFCALMWWCEGNKNESFVRFTNSDSSLIKNYLQTFRRGFDLDESKFRVLVHLHSYHNEEQQKKFWSETTKIPLKQFHKSYQKSNTGKRKHDNYQGCIAVSYYDAKIAKELEAIYNAFTAYA